MSFPKNKSSFELQSISCLMLHIHCRTCSIEVQTKLFTRLFNNFGYSNHAKYYIFNNWIDTTKTTYNWLHIYLTKRNSFLFNGKKKMSDDCSRTIRVFKKITVMIFEQKCFAWRKNTMFDVCCGSQTNDWLCLIAEIFGYLYPKVNSSDFCGINGYAAHRFASRF